MSKSSYRVEIGDAICARIAGGESKRAICAEPGMPSDVTVYQWTRRFPAFAAQYAKAMGEARAWRREGDGAAEAGRLARQAARGGKARESQYDRAVGEAVCAAISAGATFGDLNADPGLPRASTIFRWLRRHPEFAALYAQAREDQAQAKFDLAWDIARAATPEAVAVARLQVDVLRWQTARLSPSKYGRPPPEELKVIIRTFRDDEPEGQAALLEARRGNPL